MNLSEITATLRKIGVSPVKSLGQNFLHDQNLIRWIINQPELTRDDYVVEIGPGLGALTGHALDRGARVLAIEKDARLVEFLAQHFRNEKLEVLHQDALRFDVRELFAQARVKLLGNLPYYASSQLLLKFLDSPSPISLALLMLQKEVAQRLSAPPSTSDYGALTLLVQLHYHVQYLRTIPATVFYPRPEVDSAIVKFSPRAPTDLPACDHELFHQLVRRGFSQRRKQLGKLLNEEIVDWARAADHLRLERTARAEELSLNQWVALTNYVRPIRVGEDATELGESLPVVDRRDRVIGVATRCEVHGDNLPHRAVHIFIFNKAGDILLQKRSRWKDRHPLLWDSSAAGHVHAGESYDLAANRELAEELSLRISLEKVLKLPASDQTGQEFIWLYQAHHDGKMTPNPAEIEATLFFPPALVSHWTAAKPADFAPAFPECWKAYSGRT
jgi:16S rRNA (adenine1518-N6/adenine1519-N6)-dimethyltransferase